MNKRSNANRMCEATARVEKKVKRLREILEEGPIRGTEYPNSLNAFREWEDSSRGLEKIRSPSTTNARLAPHNRLLVAEADELMRQIARRSKPTKVRTLSLKDQLSNATNALNVQKALNEKLTSQLQEVMHKADILSDAEYNANNSLKTLEVINTQLRRQLANAGLSPIRPFKK